MIFKIITIKDILYENGEITNINHIKFLPGQIILEKNIFEYEATRKYVLLDKKLMSDIWEKYILFLKKLKT
jgi:DNA polymerase III epsilon subunit-like protein